MYVQKSIFILLVDFDAFHSSHSAYACLISELDFSKTERLGLNTDINRFRHEEPQIPRHRDKTWYLFLSQSSHFAAEGYTNTTCRNIIHSRREDASTSSLQPLTHRRDCPRPPRRWPPRHHRVLRRHWRRPASHGQGEAAQASRPAAGPRRHWPVPPHEHLGQLVQPSEAACRANLADPERHSGCEFESCLSEMGKISSKQSC